jgi:hypothetical protein
VTTLLLGLAFTFTAGLFTVLRKRMVPRLARLFTGIVAASLLFGGALIVAGASGWGSAGVVALALLWLLIVAFAQLGTFLVAVSAGRL